MTNSIFMSEMGVVEKESLPTLCLSPRCTNDQAEGKGWCSSCLDKANRKARNNRKSDDKLRIPHRLRYEKTLGRGSCWVYFIQMGDEGPIKIGRTTDMYSRFKALAIGCPQPIVLRARMKAIDVVETLFHREFARDRLHGEWFEPSDKLTNMLADMKRGIFPETLGGEDWVARIKEAQRFTEL